VAGTRATTASDSDKIASLVTGLRIDTERDRRSCRQPSCHGHLTLFGEDDDRVICPFCCVTPDDVFLTPPRRDDDEDTDRERYDHSGRVVLPGGWEQVYDQNDERRPDSVTDEYTFDLTTVE